MFKLSALNKRSFSLQNTQLTLNVLKPGDVSDKYVDWMNNYDVTKFTEQHYTKHNKNDVITFVSEMYNSAVNLLLGIYFDHQHIGNVKLGPINFNHKVSEISYIIGEKQYLGKGIGSEAIGVAVKIAFDDIGLHKVTAGTHENNLPSINVLKKNGFVEEGRRKKQLIFENRRVDVLLFGKVREDHV